MDFQTAVQLAVSTRDGVKADHTTPLKKFAVSRRAPGAEELCFGKTVQDARVLPGS